MKRTQWQNVEKIFNQTIFLPAEERYGHALEACGDNKDLLREVIELLEEAENNENFLSDPIYSLGNKILASIPQDFLDKTEFAFYDLLEVLGRGGSSVVFLAKDKRLDRLVALKILPYLLPDNHETILRFQREAKAASAISHQNVAHIYEFNKAEDRFYIAMEYVTGETLRQMLKKNAFELLRVLDISIQITRALIVSHRANIIHRDIKPENIMVTDENLVKVLDFGLAKTFYAGHTLEADMESFSLLTSPGLVIGTVGYMSPEQVRGQKLDSRTDLWSLGVTLYEMLVGERPFTGETQSDVQAKILLAEPDFPAKLNEIPGIVDVLKKLLSKDVESRYQNASDVLNDLEFIKDRLSSEVQKKKTQLSFPNEDENVGGNKKKSFKNFVSQKFFPFKK